MRIDKLVKNERGEIVNKTFLHSGDAWYLLKASTILRYQGRNTVRHYARQRYMDYSRRGTSNREGANNRAYRKYLTTRKPRIASFGNIWEIIG